MALVLLLLSSFMHSAWNVASKNQKNVEKEFFLVAILFVNIPLLILSAIFYKSLVNFDLKIFLFAMISGFFQMLYFYLLSKIYNRGRISVAYPIARSFPVIFVIIFSSILKKQHFLGIPFILGGALVVFGSVVINFRPSSESLIKQYLSRDYAFAYLVALISSGYLLCDNEAMIHVSSQISTNYYFPIIVYLSIRAFSTLLFMCMITLPHKKNREIFIYQIRQGSFYKLIAGLSIYVTYFFVLISMQLLNNVTLITTVRQLSIPITALAGVIFFKEPKTTNLGIGIIFIVLGVIFSVNKFFKVY